MANVSCLTCLLLFTPLALEIAQTKDNYESSLHESYVQLDRQIFARHDDPDSEKIHISDANKVSQIRSKLHELTDEAIGAALKGPSPSPQGVMNAISALHGEMSFVSGWGPQATNTPFATSFKANGVQGAAIAYVILQGGDAIPDTQPYLEFWDQASGTWAMKADAPTRSDFRGHTFCVAQMDSGVPGEVWFLAWGMTIGNPGTPVDVRLYGFDGQTIRTVWKRDDLTRGKVTVTKSSVTLEYDREYRSNNPDNRVREVLHVTPNGLE